MLRAFFDGNEGNLATPGVFCGTRARRRGDVTFGLEKVEHFSSSRKWNAWNITVSDSVKTRCVW